MLKQYEELLFIAMVPYFGFYLIRALLTGKAQIWRNRRPALRYEKPLHYWLFTGAMAFGVVMFAWAATTFPK